MTQSSTQTNMQTETESSVKYPYLGATVEEGGVRFRVVSPPSEKVEVVLEGGESYAMTQEGDLFEAFVEGVKAGTRYRYRFDGDNEFPDPASRFQPEGVHGPSEVVDPSTFEWSDGGWQGVPHKNLVFYELHVGTFTQEGTYNAAKEKLPYLKDLGITAVELLPVSDFPGERNWGYDPAAQYAPTHAYGTPDELREFVNEAHKLGLAVYLDVVYNHFGPDGAYVVGINPQMFTDKHETPWGQAINMDDEGAEHVRQFFLENAVHWLTEYHFDGFRLDAVFAIIDDSPKHFLAELTEACEDVPGWRRFLIAEDPRNYRKLVEPRSEGGYGLDGIWADDFHHIVRVNLAGDRYGYFKDFEGTTEEMAATLEQGWYYTGQHSENEGEERGTTTEGLRPEHFTLTIQNHDQVGNRPRGNRLSDETSPGGFRAASALLLFAPQLPLMFMGQEWATKTPFQYFTDHNEELGKLVSEGRKEEFKDFPDFQGDVPDPQDPETFTRSKLDWNELEKPEHANVHKMYQELLTVRPDFTGEVRREHVSEGGLVIRRDDHVLAVALRENVQLPLPENAQPLWQSEDYAVEPGPPEITGQEVRFTTPGAVLFKVSA